MVSVRKHSKRRVHAYQPSQSPANGPRKVNVKRIAAGLRPVHVHRKQNIIDLGRSLSTHPAKAVYGWLSTQVSLFSADIARRESQNRARYRPVVNDISRESRVRRETLSRLAQAKHKMECLLHEELPVESRHVRYRVLPTTANVTGVDGTSVDGWQAIPKALQDLATSDERYAAILALIDPGLAGRV